MHPSAQRVTDMLRAYSYREPSKRNSKDIVVPLSQGEDLMNLREGGQSQLALFFACASLHDVWVAYGSHPSLEGSPIDNHRAAERVRSFISSASLTTSPYSRPAQR